MLAGVFAACQQQEQEAVLPVKENGTLVHFKAAPLETKTAFAEPTVEDGIATYPTRWTSNDTEVAISLNFAPAVNAGVVPTGDGVEAEFEADFADVEATAPYTFYVVSPATALDAVSPSRKALAITVPSVQTPLATSSDEAAQILVAKSEASQSLPEDLDVHFSHLTGYGRLTLKNLPEDAAVASVTLVSPEQPWAGSWYYNPADGSVEAKEASSSLTIKTDASGDIWFACAPVDMAGKKLKVSVATKTGNYEREITLNGKNVDFSAGHVYKFAVNMENAEFIENEKEVYYELVTDASTLKAGDVVIIANVPSGQISSYMAISTKQNNNNRSATGITVEDDKIYDPAEDVEIFTVETGSANGTWSFKTQAGLYIASAQTNNNRLYSNTSKDGYSSWTVSISNKVATMKSSQGVRGYLLYNANNGNPIFSCYQSTSPQGSTTSLVALYRKTEGDPIAAEDDPILEEETFGAYLNGENALYAKGTQQLSREYKGKNVIFAILDPGENTIYEFSGIPAAAAQGDSFSLTYSVRRGKKELSKGTYAVSVVGEAGAKLWLSDGAGNGFIVKR